MSLTHRNWDRPQHSRPHYAPPLALFRKGSIATHREKWCQQSRNNPVVHSAVSMTQVAQPFSLRQLGPGDAAAFSALRREVTRENAVPMGLTFKEELTRTLEGFRAQLSSPSPNAVFGAFAGDALVATAAVSRVGQFPSSHHKMVMWGVFTSPLHRRQGIGRQLVATALRHAFRNSVHRVNLQVYVPNEPAIALYRAIGFVEYGVEREAVCLDGQYHDAVHMTLEISKCQLPLESPGLSTD